MSKFKIFFSTIFIFLFGVIFSYSLVFAGPLAKVEKNFTLSKNIILNSYDLSSNKIILKTTENPENFTISGECGVVGKLTSSEKDTHVFTFSVTDKNCEKSNIDIVLSSKFKTLKFNFKIISEYDLLTKYLDYSTEDLQAIVNASELKLKELKSYQFSETEVEEILKNYRNTLEVEYLKIFFQTIIAKRDEKYLIPAMGSYVGTRETKVPNSLRPYRSSYTDGIHHGWDFDAKKGTTVIALDDGIVLRVYDDFTDADYDKIQYTNVTDEIKLTNLDILRGNQVWIKTMKGDVVFYSHLNEVFSDIKPGMMIKRGQPLGTVGATGVPEEGYSDFHLHLAIQKNPLDSKKAGTYTFMDYMAWPWSFKGETARYAIEHGYDIFEKN